LEEIEKTYCVDDVIRACAMLDIRDAMYNCLKEQGEE